MRNIYKQLIHIILFVAFCGKDVLCKKHKVKRNVNSYVGGNDRIVGGNDTTINLYPYQAFLSLYDGEDFYQCGGSIISEKFIVTAAHCLSGIKTIHVRIGSTNSQSGGSEYETDSFDFHPLYNATTSDYDVGVVRVNGMTLDGKNASAISLIESGSDVPDGKTIVLTGWGYTSEDGETSTYLRNVSVPAMGRDLCNKLLGGGITTRMFCAGLSEGGKDSCQGDSGGPAVTDEQLAGITSYGYGCGRPDSPGVYTLIGNEEIRSFIRKKTGI